MGLWEAVWSRGDENGWREVRAIREKRAAYRGETALDIFRYGFTLEAVLLPRSLPLRKIKLFDSEGRYSDSRRVYDLPTYPLGPWSDQPKRSFQLLETFR